MALKSLWRGLFGKGLWSDVFKAKYLKNILVLHWLCKNKVQCEGSIFWKGLLSLLPWLKQWLAWRVGNGEHVILGRDPFLGCGGNFRLFEELINYLNLQGFHRLNHIKKVWITSSRSTYWMMALDLGLHDNLAVEWDTFINNLNEGGIRLTNFEDSLVWSWDNVEGKVSVKKAYEVVSAHLSCPDHKWWFSLLWRWRLLLKLKVFGWLVLQNRLLTGDNLIKRGYYDPFVCPLCQIVEETINHLFISCTFAQEVWSYIVQGLNISTIEPLVAVEDAIFKWCLSGMVALPIFIAWCLWRNKNSPIFERKGESTARLSDKIIAYFLEYAEHKGKRRVRVPCFPSIVGNGVVGFFDGAS